MAPNEFNFDNEDDRNVASLLRSLKRVEAPADFDLRLKRRIARRAASGTSASLFAPWLRFAALPLMLVGIVAFLAFSGMLNFESSAVPPVAETRFQPVPASVAEPTVSAAESPRVIARDETAPTPFEAVNQTVVAHRDRRTPVASRSASLSFDTGLGIANKVIQPPGIPVDPRVVSPGPDGPQDGGIAVKDILSSIGVTAERSADGWTVKTVTSKSQAEKSDVRAADVVEAVGSHTVKGKDSLQGRVSVDSITVMRGGKRIVIKLSGR